MRAFNLATLTLGAGCLVSPAHAAVEPFASFATGFAHPVLGIDHILAMVCVGVWGVLAGGRALWVWPAAFVSTMLAGFAAATLGFQLPGVPAAVAASIIVLGLMVALAVRAPLWLGAALIGLFAFFHGHAHGTEAIAGSLVAYGAGFALATAALHAAGIGLALATVGSIGKLAVQAMGALAVLGGLALIGA
jgi:urease accessory protein